LADYYFTPVSILVGVCGGSGSGKTTIARLVAAELGASRITFDSYYQDQAHLTPEERIGVNYDHPDSLDTVYFEHHLDLLSAGSDVEVPIYDFTNHTRTDETELVEATSVVIIEGILLLAFPEVVKRLELKVFRDCPEKVRFARRLGRDLAERGRTEASVYFQFEETVKPMHDQYVQPSLEHADIVTFFDEELHSAADRVMAAISQLASV